jgi:hypoxanthine phosphoribosyltransferase
MTHPFLASMDCLYDRGAIDTALDRMAADISAKLADKHPLMLCVLHGGLIFSGHLLTRLQFPLQQDYIHATRYRGQLEGHEKLEWLASPHTSLKDRTVVLLDDILDEGFTLEAIREACLLDGAKAVFTAVLLKKNHPRPVAALKADFVGMEVGDRYVFGFGMDYKHEWRNANGIYAVPVDMIAGEKNA